MSTQEILLEEIKHQPESVLRELQQYLAYLKSRPQPGLSMGKNIAESWEKLGPAPEVDYDRL